MIAVIHDRQMLAALTIDLEGRWENARDGNEALKQATLGGLLDKLGYFDLPGPPGGWPARCEVTEAEAAELFATLEQIEDLNSDPDAPEDFIFLPRLRLQVIT
jgi:hypothetical protein